MDKSPKKDHLDHLTPQLLVELTHSLHRIFKIGNYYPAGHKIVDQATESFSIILKKVAGTNRTVLFEIKDNKIFVEELLVKSSSKASEEIYTILDDTGISSIQIDREITVREMLLFVQVLLTHRAQSKSARNFVISELSTKMPDSIKIKTKKFLVDESSVVDQLNIESSQQELELVFQALTKEGLSQVQVDQCRNLLDSLSKSYVSNKPANSDLPAFTWNDVQNLLVNVIKKTFQPEKQDHDSLVHNDVNALATILSNLEQSSEDEKSKESINLLLSLVKKKEVKSTANTPKNTPRKADQAPTLSVEQIQQYVNKAKLKPALLKKLPRADKTEEITVLFQLLQHKQEDDATQRSKFFLRDILSSPLNQKEWQSLLDATKYFFDTDNHDRLNTILPNILLQLRASEYSSSLHFLQELSEPLTKSHYSFLWPAIVNEIVAVGLTKKPKAYMALSAKAASIPPKEMMALAERLIQLDTFQEKVIAQNVFLPTHKPSFLLFSFLLTTPLRQLLLTSIAPLLQKHPPDWLGEIAFPFINVLEEQHVNFIQNYLANVNSTTPPQVLQIIAGELLITHLPVLPEDRREEPWVSKTISACGKLRVDGVYEMLGSITNTKKMLFLHDWPTECRLAAEGALKQLPPPL